MILSKVTGVQFDNALREIAAKWPVSVVRAASEIPNISSNYGFVSFRLGDGSDLAFVFDTSRVEKLHEFYRDALAKVSAASGNRIELAGGQHSDTIHHVGVIHRHDVEKMTPIGNAFVSRP